MTDDGASARDPEARLAHARLVARMLGDEGAGGMRVGRFALLERLAAGGMGVVFAAYDAELDRKVAVKLLRGDVTDDAQRRRIVREAQAMAKLSHPNVAQVYEVGEHEGTTFIAMELVDGQTLRVWQREHATSWRVVLAAYLEAGRGLAAAHAARLIHRDFKPDNVIVGSDGRTRVLDFGLARQGEIETTGEHPTSSGIIVPHDDAMATPLTRDGEVMGTPAYMAPEQFRGEDVGAHSDQFSWCVAAWEGLFGQRPFAGNTRATLVENLMDGRVTPPPRGPVPAAVKRALLRGLAVAPAQRFASMDALLAAVQTGITSRRRRIVAVVATAGVAATVIAASLLASSRTAPCSEVGDALAETWDEPARVRVQAAMLAPQREFATAALARVEAGIDAYAQAWIDARRDACMTTQRGEQSAALMDARMACLDAREHALAAIVAAIEGGDADTFARADRLVEGLPAIDRCADKAYVEARTPAPTDPGERALGVDVERRLELLRALAGAGKLAEAKAMVEPLAESVARLEHPSLVAEVGLAIATYHEAAGDFAAAEREQTNAYFTAYRAADDVLTMLAALDLFREVGDEQQRFTDAATWEQHAEAAIARAGTDRERMILVRDRAVVRTREGRIDEAITAANEAIELALRIEGEDGDAHAAALSALATALELQGHHAEAIAVHERELASISRRLGPDHPMVANTENNLGGSLTAAGRHAEAQARFEHALAVRERAYGPEHPLVAQSLANLGARAYGQGEYPRALELLRRALEIQERARGVDDPEVAMTLSVLGEVLAAQGELDEAERVLVRAIDIQQQRLPDGHPHRIGPLLSLANLRLVQHREADALPIAQQALAAFELRFGPDHPTVAYPLIALTRIETGLGHHTEAVAAAERAVALRDAAKATAVDRAAAESALADALWPEPRQRARARALAEHARSIMAGDTTAVAVDGRAELDRWLAAHRLP